MFGLQGFFSKIILIVRIFSKIVRIFVKMCGFVKKNVRIVRIFFSKIVRIVLISSKKVRIFVRIFSKKFWPPCIYQYLLNPFPAGYAGGNLTLLLQISYSLSKYDKFANIIIFFSAKSSYIVKMFAIKMSGK